jgi:hypothetical protein
MINPEERRKATEEIIERHSAIVGRVAHSKGLSVVDGPKPIASEGWDVTYLVEGIDRRFPIVVRALGSHGILSDQEIEQEASAQIQDALSLGTI